MIDQILLLTAIIALFVIVFFSLKLLKGAAKIGVKKLKGKAYNDEQLDEKTAQYFEKYDEELSSQEEAHKRKAIRPQSKHYRDLDLEVGGLEEGKAVESDGKNPWNDRSDEIDRIGSIFQLGGSGKESMIWRKKKEKLVDHKDDDKKGKKKRKKGDDDHDHGDDHHGSGISFDSRGDKGGFMQMIRTRQDHGHDGGGRIL